MKKYINFTFLCTLILCFCSFLFGSFTQTKLTFAKTDIVPSELEIKEYRDFEHGILTSTTPAEEDVADIKITDTIPSSNYTVVIDAGHGGPDPGSIGYKTKVYEADLNLKFSKLLKNKLEKSGINVVMTRTNENALAEGRGKAFKKRDMQMRKDIIKNTRPNMVVSIHQNSFTNHSLRGAQVFYDKTSEISKQIAELIQIEFKKNLPNANKSISPGDYYMLKCTAAPSIIVECGFLSNAEEEKLLQEDAYISQIINSIYIGIINFLQIK